MSTTLRGDAPSAQQDFSGVSGKRFAVLVAEWNADITERLFSGARQALLNHGVPEANIVRKNVPGSFELSLGAQKLAQKEETDAVICLGCVIRGETKHFDFICDAVAYGITEVSLKYDKPVIFGVLTTENEQQAYDRAGGKYGNKGEEAALAALQMLSL